MVSFSCEACNDVLPKKKLDAHRNSCWNAAFTCLDCMTTFGGTQYRSHTSCISEAQKYQGALYNKADRPDRKQARSKNARLDAPYSSRRQPRNAYVEDVPDPDSGTVAIVEPPPPAPSPPLPPQLSLAVGVTGAGADAAQSQSSPSLPKPGTINVFDFLVDDDTPNASRTNIVSIEPPPSEVRQETATPDDTGRQLRTMAQGNESRETFGESRYAENGFHYGQGPVPAFGTAERHLYLTPAPHKEMAAGSHFRSGENSKDRKRKRVQVEDLHITTRLDQDDEIMTDAPPVLHSGLTGGLNRLMTRPDFPPEYPPSPDYSSGDGGGGGDDLEPSPGTPLKRTKRRSLIRNPIMALVPARRRSSVPQTGDGHNHSNYKLSRHHRSGRHHRDGEHRRRSKHRHERDADDDSDRPSPPPPSRKIKAIKYRSTDAERRRAQSHGNEHSNNSNHNNGVEQARKSSRQHRHQSHDDAPQPASQLVLYRSHADLFLSFVNKGPESEKGCSINKALKRYHREIGTPRGHDEKELWKSLRLRRNERGEIVLFAAPSSGTAANLTAVARTNGVDGGDDDDGSGSGGDY